MILGLTRVQWTAIVNPEVNTGSHKMKDIVLEDTTYHIDKYNGLFWVNVSSGEISFRVGYATYNDAHREMQRLRKDHTIWYISKEEQEEQLRITLQ